jgi:hypothetical protein
LNSLWLKSFQQHSLKFVNAGHRRKNDSFTCMTFQLRQSFHSASLNSYWMSSRALVVCTLKNFCNEPKSCIGMPNFIPILCSKLYIYFIASSSLRLFREYTQWWCETIFYYVLNNVSICSSSMKIIEFSKWYKYFL